MNKLSSKSLKHCFHRNNYSRFTDWAEDRPCRLQHSLVPLGEEEGRVVHTEPGVAASSHG